MTYYQRKGELQENLTETLYAMMHERSSILETKKKYFFNNESQQHNQSIDTKISKHNSSTYQVDTSRPSLKREEDDQVEYDTNSPRDAPPIS